MRARRIEWTCYLPDRPLRPCRRHHFHGYAWTGSTFTAAASELAPSPASRLLQWDCVHPADSRSIGGMHASGICVHPAGSHSIERACMHARGNCAHSAGCMSIERACTTFVGAGLLAKAACQARTMSDGPTSSRASALLQWMACIQRVRVQLGACMPVEIACIRRGCISIQRACIKIRRSRLAGESGVSGDDDVGWAGVFAGKRAPAMAMRAFRQDCSIRTLRH